MKHCCHQHSQKLNPTPDVEFGSEFAPLNNALDKEANQAFLSAKAGGMITKNLVALGEKMLMNQQNK